MLPDPSTVLECLDRLVYEGRAEEASKFILSLTKTAAFLWRCGAVSNEELRNLFSPVKTYVIDELPVGDPALYRLLDIISGGLDEVGYMEIVSAEGV